ncbi:MAG TPA: hypothetical protein VF490_12295 [Chryseosolibacter sp.]
MSYRPDEKDWMAYLYGEMEEGEKLKFESYIEQHADAREELGRWKNLRAMLSRADEKEVIAPPLFIDDRRRSVGGRAVYWLRTPYVKIAMSVAASLLVVILAGSATRTRMTISGHEFRLSFGEVQEGKEGQQNAASPILSEAQVQEMINTSLNRNNSLMQANLEETQKKLDASIRKNLALNSGRINDLLKQASTASQQQITQYVQGMRQENMQQVKDYFQLTSTEQKKYIENLLVDFAQYLQQQRNSDLELVQTQMKSLEQNTNLFKQETEQILSGIITTVGTPVRQETRN